MKRAIIALSVAAGMIGAAQAENQTTLYGSLGFQTQVQRDGSNVLKVLNVKDNTWDLKPATMKLGVDVQEDLSADMQAVFKLEFGYDPDNGGAINSKKAYIGFKGNFGQILLGRQSSLYKMAVNYNDNFQDSWFGPENSFIERTGGGTLSKTISYMSPDYSGFKFGLAGVMDGSHTVVADARTNNKAFPAAQVAALYDANGFFAGLAYSWTSNKTRNVNVVGGSVGFSNDQFKAGLGVEHADKVGQKYNLGGEYYYGPHTFRAGFGASHTNEVLPIGSATGVKFKDKHTFFTYGLGYQYNFSKRTYSWVEGDYIDYNSKYLKNGYTVKVGVRHDF